MQRIFDSFDLQYMIDSKNTLYIPDIVRFISLAYLGLTRRKLETKHPYFNFLDKIFERQIHHDNLKLLRRLTRTIK